ncbi:MAG: Gfo/Idh/MocA family protein, partial [bacterium]
TRHDSHASYVIKALRAGKHVFVEKPLCLNKKELEEIKSVYNQTNKILMVGFNRRFSPLSIITRGLLLGRREPLSIIYTVNAGAIPSDHWIQDPGAGGGRIIGEACHFIDLIRYFVGSPIIDVNARIIGEAPSRVVREDKMTIMLEFADGSTGVIHYLANGSKRYPKERIEIFSEGRILVINNFKTLRGYSWKGFKGKRLWRQDKGHKTEAALFIQQVREGGEPIISWSELEEVTLATFTAVERAKEPARGL